MNSEHKRIMFIPSWLERLWWKIFPSYILKQELYCANQRITLLVKHVNALESTNKELTTELKKARKNEVKLSVELEEAKKQAQNYYGRFLATHQNRNDIVFQVNEYIAKLNKQE